MSKYLGQHFLINKRKIEKIVETLELKDDDIIIEIGPGHGELTKEIIEKLRNQAIKKFKIIAIEKDKELAENLRNLIEIKKLRNYADIVHGDALKILPHLISQFPNFPISKYKIVGNIPYYITGYLLRVLGELENKPSLIVLTIQKEVAERIAAKPPKMNLLAASVQFWAEPQIIANVPKKDFQPAPKVDSTIIQLVIKKLSNYEITQLPNYPITNYYKFIKILFKQPRKTITNNLFVVCRDAKNTNTRECREKISKKLAEIDVNPQARPQDLSIEQIKELSTLF